MMTWAPPWPFFALACLVVATLVLSTALLDSSKAADMPITTSRVTVQVFGGGIP